MGDKTENGVNAAKADLYEWLRDEVRDADTIIDRIEALIDAQIKAAIDG